MVRASDSSFQIRWLEKTYEDGAPKDNGASPASSPSSSVAPRTAEQIAQEPARPLRPLLQLVAGPHRRRQMNWPCKASLLLVMLALPLGACAAQSSRSRRPMTSSHSSAAAGARTGEAGRDRRGPQALAAAGAAQAAPAKRPRREAAAQQAIAKANQAARMEPTRAGYINAVQVYPWTDGALYRLYASPEKVSTIALQAGEELIDVSTGDTVRWVIGDTLSGQGTRAASTSWSSRRCRISQTNLVITHRSAHLSPRAALHRRDLHGLGVVDLSGDRPVALKADRAKAEAGDAAIADARHSIWTSLHFRYRIEGEAPWKPRQVFDDGPKVYIQFPSGLAQGEAPPLFVIGGDGKPALVNYRVRGATYIVDRLFAAAELRLGTAPQTVVRIVRTDAVWRENRG